MPHRLIAQPVNGLMGTPAPMQIMMQPRRDNSHHRELRHGDQIARSRTIVLRHNGVLGLGANALLGWWWADPAAAFVIAAVAAREGVESWRGEGCADGCC